MFDAIEDTPSVTLIAELESRGYKVTKRLRDHVVLFIMPENPLVLEGFLCDAEDADHAEEQALDAYPQLTSANVVWIEEGTDWGKAQDNYYAAYLG